MLWGRGALDMKGMGTLELLVMLLFKRLNLTPNRDLIFLAVADEEAGSMFGMEWLDRNEPEWITEPEFALNEGGMGALNLLGSNRPIFACSPSEKSPLWLKLRAEGQPGHGSTPMAITPSNDSSAPSTPSRTGTAPSPSSHTQPKRSNACATPMLGPARPRASTSSARPTRHSPRSLATRSQTPARPAGSSTM